MGVFHNRLIMQLLVAALFLASSSLALVHYPNGAAVPFHAANVAATNAHLASKGYYGFVAPWGRKKREADPLVHYPNGAAVPYDGANIAATNAHFLSKGYGYPYLHAPYLIGKKKREADSLVHYPNGAAVPYDGANLAATSAHLASKGFAGYPFVHATPFIYGRKKREADPTGAQYGKKKREADPLVHCPNGAAVPYDGANLAATSNHLASKGFVGYPFVHATPFIYGKKKREADPLVHYPNGAAVPYDGANIAATNA